MKELERREFLKYAGIGGALLFCGVARLNMTESAFAENVKEIKLTASVNKVDLGAGKTFKAWTYNGQAPGPGIRVKEGETLRVIFKNNLPEATTIHWHGLPVPNRMDGVPYVTQKPVEPGGTFTYEFEAFPAGTYVYHSHASYQLDRGLYGPLIVEPKKEEMGYDREYILLLEDWAAIDGGGPEASRMGKIQPGMGMMGMGMMGGGMMGRGMMGMMRGSPRPGEPLREPLYDAYALNGKVFSASEPLKVRKGDKVRLRIINPSSSTIYTLRISGHSLKITHADARPVMPAEVDALRIGQGERYDVELHANSPGRWLIYNLRDGSPVGGWFLGTLLYEGISSKSYDDDTLSRFRISDYGLLEGKDERHVRPVLGGVGRIFRMNLSGGMMGSPYWTINGRMYPNSEDFSVGTGEVVRFEYFNMSMMPHPMHLHGHFFEVVGTGRVTGVRAKKDTIIIPPHMGRGAIEFIADNPGVWMHHCHNLYHMEAGMANLVTVR
ncbi:MAG: multicopper oxidase family protein [Nitrospirota bacterium]